MSTDTVNGARLKLSFPMAFGVVLSIGLGFFILGVIDNASRSIGWIVFSACIAMMLYPAVNVLQRFMPKLLAVVLLVLFVISMIAVPVYSVVDDVNSQTNKLERSLPQRAQELEREGRFADSFREFGLAEKTREALASIPDALQGGNSQERIRANANRAIAFVAGGVLMLFFLLYGNKLVKGSLTVINDEKKRQRFEELLTKAYSRCTLFGWTQIALSLSAGLVTFGICRMFDIPAAGLLGTWVALWNVVPIFGVIIGTLPVVLLAGSQSMKLAWGLLALFIAYEFVESLVRHKLLGPHAIRMDGIITILIVFGGIELYGLGGALAGLVIGSFLHALASEVASTHPE